MQKPARKKSGGRKFVVIALTLALVCVVSYFSFAGTGRYGVNLGFARMFGSTRSDIQKFRLKKATMVVSVKAKGSLESAKNIDVINKVEGQTSIIMILPEGKRVTKDEIVCELDSASLKDALTNQLISTERALADFANAEKTFDVAKIAVNEYVDGLYPQTLEQTEGEIKMAESNLSKAKDRFEWSKRMLEKKYVSPSQCKADEQSLENCVIALTTANTKKRVLRDYTRGKETQTLAAEVEKAKSDREAKRLTLSLEKDKQKKLEQQIINCTLRAPSEGIVVYANDPNQMRGGQSGPQIEEGATVRERQKIFSLPDIKHMRVNTKVHESKVDLIIAKQSARVRVDAFPGTMLKGSVNEVKPMPDQTSFFSSDVKLYTTLVAIEDGPPSMRPGMTAEVEILISQKDNVLSVPVQTITQFQGKDHITVLKPDGTFDLRVVKLGESNDQHTEVVEGLKEGDEVAMSPVSLMTDEQRRDFSSSGSKDAGKGKGWSEAGTVVAPGAPGGPPGPGGAPGAGKGAGAKAKKKGARGPGGGMSPEMKARFDAMSPEEKAQMKAMRDANGGGFGGPGGGAPGGPGGGGPGA